MEGISLARRKLYKNKKGQVLRSNKTTSTRSCRLQGTFLLIFFLHSYTIFCGVIFEFKILNYTLQNKTDSPSDGILYNIEEKCGNFCFLLKTKTFSCWGYYLLFLTIPWWCFMMWRLLKTTFLKCFWFTSFSFWLKENLIQDLFDIFEMFLGWNCEFTEWYDMGTST
jgi:hypothetical protein